LCRVEIAAQIESCEAVFARNERPQPFSAGTPSLRRRYQITVEAHTRL
jgi:hypothetical protein